MKFGNDLLKDIRKKVKKKWKHTIFLRYIDCVYQLIIEFHTEFEFNSEYLLYIAFIFNNEEERGKNKDRETTPFVWTYLLNNKEKYMNPLYD